MTETTTKRRNLFRAGGTGLGLMAAGALLDAPRAAAQACPFSKLHPPPAGRHGGGARG